MEVVAWNVRESRINDFSRWILNIFKFLRLIENFLSEGYWIGQKEADFLFLSIKRRVNFSFSNNVLFDCLSPSFESFSVKKSCRNSWRFDILISKVSPFKNETNDSLNEWMTLHPSCIHIQFLESDQTCMWFTAIMVRPMSNKQSLIKLCTFFFF